MSANKLKIIFIILILLGQIGNAAEPANAILLGSYWNRVGSTGSETGILAIRTLNDGNWKIRYSADNFPKKINNEHFENISCEGENCIAVGYHSEKCWQPILLTSSDKGLSWKQPTKINGMSTKFTYLQGRLNNSYCADNFCIVTGNIYDPYAQPETHTSVLISEDNGNTWSLPASTTTNELSHITCDNAFCLASTSETKSSTLLISNDHGNHWQSKEIAKKNLAVADMITADHNFIVVGRHGENSKFAPIIMVSKDHGQSFTINDKIEFPKNTSAMIESVHCFNNTCAAAGYYYADKKNWPLAFISKDAGNTWTHAEFSSDLPHKTVSTYIRKSKVSCTASACTILSTYHTGGETLPLLFSINTANAPYKITVTSNDLPKNLDFTDIDCNSTTCYIGGRHSVWSEEQSHPKLFSVNGDLTQWQDISGNEMTTSRGVNIYKVKTIN